MPSFLEKLKKGMGIEEIEIEEKEAIKKDLPKTKARQKEPEVKKEKPPQEIAPPKEKKIEVKELKEKKPEEKEEKKVLPKEESWLESEGQLVVDVYQTDSDLFIQSPIAGIKAQDLDIQIEGDTITIKGERQRPLLEKVDFFSQECYWGKFSRQIILPVEVDPNRAEATFREGILTIKIPKLLKEKKRKIIPKE